MADRILKNSSLNKDKTNLTVEESEARAEARAHVVSEAFKASEGNAGLSQGDKAKKAIRALKG